MSGAILVAVGLLLFFDRDGWLRVAFNRALRLVGLGVPSRASTGVSASEPPATTARARLDLREHRCDVDAAVRRARTARVAALPSRAGARSPAAGPRPAWYHATVTWTSPWKKSRSSGGAARQASSSSSCASK